MSILTKTVGRVGLVIKGDYNNSTTYEVLDVVRYNNASYVCKATCVGIVPTDTLKWNLLAQDGNDGVVDGNLVCDTINSHNIGVLSFPKESIELDSSSWFLDGSSFTYTPQFNGWLNVVVNGGVSMLATVTVDTNSVYTVSGNNGVLFIPVYKNKIVTLKIVADTIASANLLLCQGDF